MLEVKICQPFFQTDSFINFVSNEILKVVRTKFIAEKLYFLLKALKEKKTGLQFKMNFSFLENKNSDSF